MIFRQLFDRDTCTYTYLIASAKGREAIIIDPVLTNIDQYLQLLSELDIQLMVSIDTHIHADHITATGHLKEKTQCQAIMGEKSKAECLSMTVKENELIRVDNLVLKTMYTPGHTDDSYSFLMKDRVFTGDTLFIRGTGRTDFQNGDAHAQYDSLFNKLLRLDRNTRVYPGHDYRGQTCSTIWEEKQFNPRLQVNSADDYATLMSKLNLPPPKHMDIAVPANLHCGLSPNEK